MDGAKRILVFSDAGGTGRSYHADLDAQNQQRRVHFLLEPGWRADNAIQGLGRTNRTNQASAPLFRPVTTDVKGERRFISTIARRLDALGALTRGQRQTGGQNLFDPADNLESDYAKDALSRWFHLLYDGKLEAARFGDFVERTGLKLENPDGGLSDNLPTIQRWLNRILALPIALQNSIFEEYLGLVEARIEAAREAGTLDLGLETVRVDSFSVLSDDVLRTDPVSGAETRLVSLEVKRQLRPLRFKRLVRMERLLLPSAGCRFRQKSGSGPRSMLRVARSAPPSTKPSRLVLPQTARLAPKSSNLKFSTAPILRGKNCDTSPPTGLAWCSRSPNSNARLASSAETIWCARSTTGKALSSLRTSMAG